MTDDQKPSAFDPETDLLGGEPEAEAALEQRRRGPGRPFARGTSGNRNGRPAQPSAEIDFRKILLSELTRRVSMPGVRGKVPAIQGVIRGAIVSAVKGNSRSQHEVLEMFRQISREKEVLRDLVNAIARDTGVNAKEILTRLRDVGIEVPGNFEMVRELALEIAREKAWKRYAEARATNAEAAAASAKTGARTRQGGSEPDE
jgi:hypothetical protein